MKSKIYTILLMVLAFASAFAASSSDQQTTLASVNQQDASATINNANGKLPTPVRNEMLNMSQVADLMSGRLNSRTNLDAAYTQGKPTNVVRTELTNTLVITNTSVRLDGALSLNPLIPANIVAKAQLTLRLNNSDGGNLANSASALANLLVPALNNSGPLSAASFATNNLLMNRTLVKANYKFKGKANVNAAGSNIVIAELAPPEKTDAWSSIYDQKQTFQSAGCG